MSLEEFHDEFYLFQNELKSYLLRILGNQQDAEDLAQDAFIKSSQKISTFKGNSSVKTWVFSVATNLARDHFRGQMRLSTNCQDNAREHALNDPRMMDRLSEVSERSASGKFDIKEHIDFCFTCMNKTLPIEQQISLILKDVYSFRVSDIMMIMNLSEGKVKHAIADARKLLMDIFDQKCALVKKQGVCYQCSELNGILNPKQNQQEELARIKMIAQANGKTSKEHLFKLRLDLVKKIDPLNGVGTDLHSYFLELMPGYSGLNVDEGASKKTTERIP